MNKENIGTLFALITALVSGFSIVANKSFLISLDPTMFTAVRTFFVGIGFFLISFYKNRLSLNNFNKVSWKVLIPIGIVAGFGFLAFFNGLKLTTAGRAAFLHKLLPLFVTILAFVFLFESFISHTVFSIIIYALYMVFLVLNLSPIRTPKFAGKWFYVLVVYTVVMTAIYGWILWN